jgi:flagellar motor protein MotB
VICLCLTSGCGVGTEVYTRTLHERDQFRDRAGQAEAEAAAQRRQVTALQAAVTEQQQINQSLKARVSELEAQTADQSLAQEALAQQLRASTADREELLLKLDELKTSQSPPSSGSRSPADTGHPNVGEERGGAEGKGADNQRLAAALHDVIEAGHVTVRPLPGGLVLQLAASFLFVPDKAALTAKGQQTLSAVTTALAAVRTRRLQIRMGVQNIGDSERPGQKGGAQLVAVNRGLALLRQCGAGGLVSPELVLVAHAKDDTTTAQVSSPPAQPADQDEIQIVVEWPETP